MDNQLQPVTPEIRDQLAEPLITAVRQALSEMAEAEVVVRSVSWREQATALGDITATLAISATFQGVLILCFSLDTAQALARRVFAESAAEFDALLIQDCMGEIANVIAGLAKTLLVGTPYYFHFSTPTVTATKVGTKLRENSDSLEIAFDSDLGDFALQLCRDR